MTLASDLSTTRSGVVRPPTLAAIGVSVATAFAVVLVVVGMTSVPLLRWIAYGIALVTSAAALVVRSVDDRRQKDKNYVFGTPIGIWIKAVRLIDLLVVLAASAHLAWEVAL